MSIFVIVFWALSILLITASYLPLLSLGHWWIRGLDYPRIPIATLTLALLIMTPMIFPLQTPYIILMTLLLGGLVLDAFRIGPYLKISSTQSKRLRRPTDPIGQRLAVISANVFIENRQTQKLEDSIQTCDPDFVCIVEADKFWENWARDWIKKYPFQVLKGQDNGYGFVLMSRHRFLETKVRFLTDKRVPSLRSVVDVDGRKVTAFVLHSRPPRPKEGPSDQRDAEMAKVAEEIAQVDGPVIVMGDLNDVSWSHTTRLFLRVSKLLDPRRGRGVYNTFPAKFSEIGFPLDHLFHSQHFTLKNFKVLPDIGSDHLPIFSELELLPEPMKKGNPDRLEEGDISDVQTFKERGRQWDGPNQTLEFDN